MRQTLKCQRESERASERERERESSQIKISDITLSCVMNHLSQVDVGPVTANIGGQPILSG